MRAWVPESEVLATRVVEGRQRADTLRDGSYGPTSVPMADAVATAAARGWGTRCEPTVDCRFQVCCCVGGDLPPCLFANGKNRAIRPMGNEHLWMP